MKRLGHLWVALAASGLQQPQPHLFVPLYLPHTCKPAFSSQVRGGDAMRVRRRHVRPGNDELARHVSVPSACSVVQGCRGGSTGEKYVCTLTAAQSAAALHAHSSGHISCQPCLRRAPVQPWRSQGSMSAPRAHSSTTTPAWPRLAARCSGERPCRSGASSATPGARHRRAATCNRQAGGAKGEGGWLVGGRANQVRLQRAHAPALPCWPPTSAAAHARTGGRAPQC